VSVATLARDEVIEHINLHAKLQHLRSLLKGYEELDQHLFGIVDHFLTKLPRESTETIINGIDVILFDKLKQYDTFKLEKKSVQLQDDNSAGWQLSLPFSGSST